MKRSKYFIFLSTAIIFFSCENDNPNVPLNLESSQSFSGTFRTKDSENLSGTVTLEIADGYYQCSTSLPYGHGAGKVEIQGSTINFTDTLFAIVPAIYGPSYVFNGQHRYRFDGENLKIWRAKNVGEIEYKLNLEN